MKKGIWYIILGVVTALFISTCESTDEDSGAGTIMIQTFDAPFQGDVEHIYLNIVGVSVHRAVADSSSDTTGTWITISESDTTIDFLELVNGQMAVLLEESLATGQYSQLRLLLGDSSSIVVDGVSHELKVPSGSQSGVKLNLGFSIEEDEIAEIYMDFDASRSIHKHPKQDRYSMRPTFKVFKSELSGTISGTVTDTAGTAIEEAVVMAVQNGDTTATLSSVSGEYKFVLLEGTYTLSSEAFALAADTSYSAVSLTAGSDLTGYDFVLN
ncbi:MAG: DUF4382 domain-containing protein [Candidatus Marinimicrobia bacterium]|nr:DUF4382 domain-containing protein [Candidatus Neomarinimicrobiota bacterium]MCF7850899.1 DUF4382 domain-containing protein [Candidatus Neomarinimicrobiota bacterium]MCF7905177.1 DUF4382 domain-containing protein [Candidatus Neomarinimicrobiota bacterium]